MTALGRACRLRRAGGVGRLAGVIWLDGGSRWLVAVVMGGGPC